MFYAIILVKKVKQGWSFML